MITVTDTKKRGRRGDAISARNLRPVDAIRLATRDMHTQLEKSALSARLLSQNINLKTYAEILQQWYRCWTALEIWLHDNIPRDNSAATLVPQARAHLLRRDLDILGLNPPEVIRFTPSDNNEPGYWYGVAYVVEGSRLGSQLISRHLQRCLGVSATSGAAFFHDAKPSAHETGGHWQHWLTGLDRRLTTSQQVRSAAAAAADTFEWLCIFFNATEQTGA